MIKIERNEYVKAFVEFEDCYSITIIKKGEEDIPGAGTSYLVSKDLKKIKEFTVSDIGNKELKFVKELNVEDSQKIINQIIN